LGLIVILPASATKAGQTFPDLARKKEEDACHRCKQARQGLEQDTTCIWVNIHIYSYVRLE
jgi:hypothetical protein